MVKRYELSVIIRTMNKLDRDQSEKRFKARVNANSKLMAHRQVLEQSWAIDAWVSSVLTCQEI